MLEDIGKIHFVKDIVESSNSITKLIYNHAFVLSFDENIHDRSLVMDNNWKIVLGRGLDIFQKTNGWYDIAEYYQEKRLCKACEVTFLRK